MSKRDAVSILVTSASNEEEILLVERNPNLKFFGGFFAFPGGKVDAEDSNVPIANPDANPGVSSQMVVAAARELFEETGLWAGEGNVQPEPKELETARRALLSEEVRFEEILRRYKHTIDAARFELLGRMTTPPFSPVRYDTWFFHYRTDDMTTVDIWPGELVSGRVIDATSVAREWNSGEIHLAPPMVVILCEWEKGPRRAKRAIRDLCERYLGGDLHRIYFSPGILLVPLMTPTRAPATHTNTLVVGEQRLFLVDPSPIDEAEQQRLFGLLDRLLAEGKSLEAILLTHYHPDHVGAVLPTVERYGVPVWAHPKTAEALPHVTVGRKLSHGESLDLGASPDGHDGWTLSVYHVPGHAPGHLAFKESRYGALIVGDLVSTLSSILIDPSDGHLATYLRSLESLEPLAGGVVYPGHGPPSIHGRELLRKQIAHRASREEQLLSVMNGSAQTAGELVARVYADIPETMHSLAQRSLMSGLIKLLEEGRIEEADGGYRLVSSDQ